MQKRCESQPYSPWWWFRRGKSLCQWENQLWISITLGAVKPTVYQSVTYKKPMAEKKTLPWDFFPKNLTDGSKDCYSHDNWMGLLNSYSYTIIIILRIVTIVNIMKLSLMWVKQCDKPPMTGNGKHTAYKYGDDRGIVQMTLFYPHYSNIFTIVKVQVLNGMLQESHRNFMEKWFHVFEKSQAKRTEKYETCLSDGENSWIAWLAIDQGKIRNKI